jgi:hypothetical protein
MEDMRNKVIFGGIYEANPSKICSSTDRINGYDQHYGLFVPVFNQKTGKVHMVDTYKIDMYCNYENAIKKLKQFSESGAYTISKAYSEYYYNSSPELTESNFHLFTFLGNLEDYHEVSKRDYVEYEDADKINNIYLGFEWKYPSGSYLVKNGAKKSQLRILQGLNYLISGNCSFHTFWDLEEFEKNLKKYEESESVDEESISNFKKTLEKAKKYLELKEEYKRFCQELDSRS